MTAKVILNPYAGRWDALKRRQEAEDALRAAGVDYEIAVTNEPRHGIELAAQAVRQGFNPIIAAGGDGSIGEVVNGLVQAALENAPISLPTLGILPMGSANDMVDNLHLPRDLQAAARVIAAGHTRDIDVCQVNEHYFVNNSAIGLEPAVTLIQQEMKRVKGNLRYFLAILKGIIRNRHWTVHMQWEDGSFDGPVTLVTTGNSPRTGGIMYMTPHASAFDGKLTFVYGFLPSRLQLVRILPSAMKPDEGNYVENPAIHEFHTTWLRIHTEEPTPAHVDGEIFTEDGHDFHYRVLPHRLPLLLPE